MVVRVAGHSVSAPLQGIEKYLSDHNETVKHFDLLAGSSPDELTPELIKATRSPWMNSRISYKQEDWFLETARAAPWSAISVGADLCDADPLAVDGLYDRAETLWDWFWEGRPKGVAVAKISKVLYLMRPALFPILDRRLVDKYSSASRAISSALAARRPHFSSRRYRHMTWAAIRADLLDSREELRRIKAELTAKGDDATSMVAELSELRLLDMLTWTP